MCKYCDDVTKAQKDYTAKWPKFCRKCGGAGELFYSEDVAGDGGSRMQMSDYCESCIGQGKCPRCAELQAVEEWGNDEKDTCWNCGWMVGAEACPELDMCPEEEAHMFDDIPDLDTLLDMQMEMRLSGETEFWSNEW